MKLAVLLSLVCTLGVSAVVLAPGAGAVTGETGICSFPISSDQTLHGNPTDAAHFPPSGPFPGVFTGQFFVTITNDTNGHSIEVNASGPGFEPAAGGFILSGVSIWFVSSTATGDIVGPGIFLTHGPVLATNPGGVLNTELRGGKVSGNLCAAIA